MKKYYLIILLIANSICLSACKEKEVSNNNSDKQRKMTIVDILQDGSKPVLNNTKQEHIDYYEHLNFLPLISFSDEKYKESSLIYITDSRPYFMDREHISAMSITLTQNPQSKVIPLHVAKKFAIDLLPKVPPLKKEYLANYPHQKLTFSLNSEALHYQKSKNSIIYSAKFQSDQKEPINSGEEGYTPYYVNIVISMDSDSNMVITVGGMGLKFHSRSYDEYKELKLKFLSDDKTLVNILKAGLNSKHLKNNN